MPIIQNKKEILDVAIIGGGPVGIFGSFQCGMLGLKCAIFDNNPVLGGQCSMLYPDKNIYDIPGFSKIFAQNLIDNLIKQSEKFNHKNFLNTNILKINKETNANEEIFILESNQGNFLAKSVIITSGAGFFSPNKIPLKEAEKYEEKALFYSVKNKENFKNKKICILGGGDSALDWALEFANLNSEVSVIHRRDLFRGHNNSYSQIQENKNIKIITPFTIKEIIGNEENGIIEKIKIENLNDNQVQEIKCDYLFCFFGLSVNNILLKNSTIENKFNTILIKDIFKMQTSIEGIFGAGDCISYEGKLKLILTGFSEVTTAVYSAYKFIFKKQPHFQHSTSNNAF